MTHERMKHRKIGAILIETYESDGYPNIRAVFLSFHAELLNSELLATNRGRSAALSAVDWSAIQRGKLDKVLQF